MEKKDILLSFILNLIIRNLKIKPLLISQAQFKHIQELSLDSTSMITLFLKVIFIKPKLSILEEEKELIKALDTKKWIKLLNRRV